MNFNYEVLFKKKLLITIKFGENLNLIQNILMVSNKNMFIENSNKNITFLLAAKKICKQ